MKQKSTQLLESQLQGKRLLLLSCCAPCSVEAIERLAGMRIDFAVLFYNPNIYPATEYQHRLEQNKQVCERYHVPFYEGEYDHQIYLDAVKGVEHLGERSARCQKCFELRLAYAATFAKEHGFDLMTSVFAVSRWKDLNQVSLAGQRTAVDGVDYVDINWRKGGAQERRQELIKEQGIYEQPWCGCEFSKRDIKK